MTRTRLLIAAAAAILGLGAATAPLLVRKDAAVSAQATEPARPVAEVVPAESRTMERTVRLSGTLKSGSEASLSPKQGGKVVAVPVREGQSVRRGQTLVRFDVSDTLRQTEQASAGVAAARANLDKATQGERLKRMEVERRIADARRGIEQAKLQLEKARAGIELQGRAGQADVQRAQAGVDAARSQLAQARRGARPEQRRQVEIQVQGAERGVSLAKKNLEDVEYLVKKGGLPRVQLDAAREDLQKAQDGLAQARSQQAQLEAGASPEEIQAAEAQVHSAEAALSAAKIAGSRQALDRADIAAAEAQVRQAEDGLKAALASRAELQVAATDTRAARAAYDQAVAGSRLAGQQVDAAVLTSPVDGMVTAVNVNVGEMAGPGRPVVTVVGTAGVYLEVAAPSRLLAQLRPGQETSVRVDALPGQVFRGTLRSIGTVAGPDGRSFPVRIDLSAPPGVLKPGGLARAEVTAETYPDSVTVPVQALHTEGSSTSVWVVRGGRVARVPVETPLQDERRAMVRGDLRAGEPVVLSGSPGLGPGDEVEVRTRNAN